jgi:thiamine-monophosphate kinase
MNEFELISLLTRSLPGNSAVIAGAGDDCAVLDVGAPERYLLFKTDAVVEGVHFTAETSPEAIGHKAIARCLSDIAAMAGRPIAALVTLALPRKFDAGFLKKIYDGMGVVARRYELAIVGGETTTNPERMLISISMIGDVEREKCILRAGAKPGDALFVTGELGGSLAGRHLEFEPRLREARWLADQFRIHAMIDISDGLAGDLRHILEKSGVGAELLGSAIPVSRTAKLHARAGSNAKTALLAALTDGEDFELLFAIAAKDAAPLVGAWREQFPGMRLSCVGKVVAEPGLRLRDKDRVHTLEMHGYVHFS